MDICDSDSLPVFCKEGSALLISRNWNIIQGVQKCHKEIRDNPKNITICSSVHEKKNCYLFDPLSKTTKLTWKFKNQNNFIIFLEVFLILDQIQQPMNNKGLFFLLGIRLQSCLKGCLSWKNLFVVFCQWVKNIL